MKRTFAILLCILLLAALCACGQAGDGGGAQPVLPSGKSAEDVNHFKTYSEIFSAVKKAQNYGSRNMTMASAGTAVTEDTASGAVGQTKTAESAETPDYSKTNVQVAGVDEGDIVKTDGKYIYALHDGELLVYKPDGANTKLAARLSLDSTDDYAYPTELYVSGGKLAVVMSSGFLCQVENMTDDQSTVQSAAAVQPQSIGTSVALYDVSVPESPRLITTLGQDGYLVTSRLLNDRLYVVSNYGIYYGVLRETDPSTFVPCIYRDGTASPLGAEDITAIPDTDDASYAVVCVYDLATGANAGKLSVLGGGDIVYMNTDTLYLARTDYSDTASTERTEGVYTVVDHTYKNTTHITAVDLAGVSVSSSGTVPGSLYGSYALDFYNGSLRAATTDNSYSYSVYTDKAQGFENYKDNGDAKQTNAIYVLDSGMNILGRAENIAPGETIYSVRYVGPAAYLCTFRQTDPLFAYDLTDPANPVKLSELKITGFSDYLHVWTDGRLFGLGQSADANGSVTGMKMVMFDTGDKTNVSVKNTLDLGNGYSEALYDPNAILIDYGKNLIGFDSDSGYSLYSYSDEAGFTKLASIADGGWGYNMRGMYIGSFLYIVGQSGLTAVDMTTFKTAASVKI